MSAAENAREQAAFNAMVEQQLALLGLEVDVRGPHDLRTGNIPCGLYFFPDGELASASAYDAFLNDVAPQRLIRSVTSVVKPGPVFRQYDDAHSTRYV